MAHVAIFDSVGYDDKDGNRCWAARGKDVKNPGDGEIERLSDKKAYPPFGAVAEKGSALAEALSAPIPTDVDPAVINARLARLAGDEPLLVDPAGDPVDEAKMGTTFSPLATDEAADKASKSAAKSSKD